MIQLIGSAICLLWVLDLVVQSLIIKADPESVEVLIVIYLRLKEDFSQN